MAAVMSIYDFFPATAPEESVDVLRSSTPSLVASGSLPLLAALFVEEAVEAVTEIAVRLSLSQSIVRAAAAMEEPEPISAATSGSLLHPNPRKPVAVVPVVVAAPEAPSADIDEDYDPYDGLDEADVWYEDEIEDRYESEFWEERCILRSHKNERKPFGAARIPLRSTKDNKTERAPVRPNKRFNHRYVAKVNRSAANKLENRIAHKHGRPAPVYWTPEDRRPKSQEERDLEEALRRSRREGHVSHSISVATLLDLQNRELTPEDYELLLLLDESVEKKKVSKDTFKSFDAAVLTEDLPVDCPICMSPMSAGEKVTTLPCSHQYHTPCIEQWLTMSSPNCPLDGLSLLHDH